MSDYFSMISRLRGLFYTRDGHAFPADPAGRVRPTHHALASPAPTHLNPNAPATRLRAKFLARGSVIPKPLPPKSALRAAAAAKKPRMH